MLPLVLSLVAAAVVLSVMFYGATDTANNNNNMEFMPNSFPHHVRFDGAMLPSLAQARHVDGDRVRRLLESKAAKSSLPLESDCLEAQVDPLHPKAFTCGHSTVDRALTEGEGDQHPEEASKKVDYEIIHVKSLSKTARTAVSGGDPPQKIESVPSHNQQEEIFSRKSRLFSKFSPSEREAKTLPTDLPLESLSETEVVGSKEELELSQMRMDVLMDKLNGEQSTAGEREGEGEGEGEIKPVTISNGEEGSGVSTDEASEGGQANGGLPEGGSPIDMACVSEWPSLCKFVDALPIPEVIDGSTGEVITIGAFKITQRLHRDLPYTTLYGMGRNPLMASTPAPTITAIRGIPTHVRWENHLEDDHYYASTVLPTMQPTVPAHGGIPIVLHLHGGETEPASDGHPDAWFTRGGEVGPTFVKDTSTYHNAQPPSTMWFHDHTAGLTALGIYHGLTGFYLLRDPVADEEFRLPSGEFDIPLMIANKVVSGQGDLHTSDHQEVENFNVRDLIVTNGKAWPYHRVQQTKYRLRFLNGCNLRLLNMSFLHVQSEQTVENTQLNLIRPNGTIVQFHQIASDGGYLNSPVPLNYTFIAPAERVEVVIDFSDYEGEVWLFDNDDMNLSPDGSYDHDLNLGAIMKFIVGPTKIPSYPLPAVMNSIPEPNSASAQRSRWLSIWELQIDSTNFTEPEVIDGTLHLLDNKRYTDNATEVLQLGTTEVWNILNITPQTHTIHLHAVKFRIISRQAFDAALWLAGSCVFPDSNGAQGMETFTSCYSGDLRLPAASEAGWKDTFLTEEHEVIKILVSASNQDGEQLPFDPTAEPGYVWHCHMAEHEDYEMMRPLLFVNPGAGEGSRTGGV